MIIWIIIAIAFIYIFGSILLALLRGLFIVVILAFDFITRKCLYNDEELEN